MSLSKVMKLSEITWPTTQQAGIMIDPRMEDRPADSMIITKTSDSIDVLYCWRQHDHWVEVLCTLPVGARRHPRRSRWIAQDCFEPTPIITQRPANPYSHKRQVYYVSETGLAGDVAATHILLKQVRELINQ